MGGKHPSHVTRSSFDASTFDEMCVNCEHTDMVPGGWGKLAEPCSGPFTFKTEQEYYAHREAELRSKGIDMVYVLVNSSDGCDCREFGQEYEAKKFINDLLNNGRSIGDFRVFQGYEIKLMAITQVTQVEFKRS